MKTYSEKLRHPKWQQKRLEIFKRDKWKCRLCGDKKTELHVHHIFYEKGKEPWEVDNDVLTTLCKHCHAATEMVKKANGDYHLSRVNKCETKNGYNLFMEILLQRIKHSLVLIIYYDEKTNSLANEFMWTTLKEMSDTIKKFK